MTSPANAGLSVLGEFFSVVIIWHYLNPIDDDFGGKRAEMFFRIRNGLFFGMPTIHFHVLVVTGVIFPCIRHVSDITATINDFSHGTPLQHQLLGLKGKPASFFAQEQFIAATR